VVGELRDGGLVGLPFFVGVLDPLLEVTKLLVGAESGSSREGGTQQKAQDRGEGCPVIAGDVYDGIFPVLN
jgi:hypothetical protein